MKWTDLYIVKDTIRTLKDMWRNGWNERNSGNITICLQENLDQISDLNRNAEWNLLPTKIDSLKNKYFLVSGTGKYFRQVDVLPEEVLGIIEINDTGDAYRILSGNTPTSELPTHLLTHSIRQQKGDTIVIHCHATNLLSLSGVLSYDEKTWSYALWNACTEAIVVFPEGVGVLPWMMPGSLEIGIETSKKMEYYRIVIWSHHGVFAAGKDLEETFGLIETAEKAAEVYKNILMLGGYKQDIGSKNLQDLADTFKINVNSKFLK